MEIAEAVPPIRPVGLAGFRKRSNLSDYLRRKYGGEVASDFDRPRNKDRIAIAKEIRIAVQKCSILLQSKGGVFYVFVFPWLGAEYDNAFQGVTGFTPYPNTIHIFLNPSRFALERIKETVAHEYNHAIFFEYQRSKLYKQTLLETFIFEGLAENFRDEVIGGNASEWSTTLSLADCRVALKALGRSVASTSHRLYEEVFFGSKRYRKWTGYSVGYRLVKCFRTANVRMNWEELIRLDPNIVFNKGLAILENTEF